MCKKGVYSCECEPQGGDLEKFLGLREEEPTQIVDGPIKWGPSVWRPHWKKDPLLLFEGQLGKLGTRPKRVGHPEKKGPRGGNLAPNHGGGGIDQGWEREWEGDSQFIDTPGT